MQQNSRCLGILIIVLFAMITGCPATGGDPVNALLPDLVVTDVWESGGLVYYQIRNTGLANAKSGHTSTLWVDGTQVSADTVTVALTSGQRLTRSFPKFTWHCSSTQDKIGVRTDSTNAVQESSELNNVLQETWKCDQTPPNIFGSPSVSNITATSARISWNTDENCDGYVDYSPNAWPLDKRTGSATPDKEHIVNLTGLKPGSTYHFTASSTDASGNTTTSGDGFFKTPAAAGSQNLKIESVKPDGGTFPMQFSATPEAGLDIDHARFYLDGRLVETDYSPPFQFVLDPDALDLTPQTFFKNLNIRAQLFDPAFASVSSTMMYAAAPPLCFPVELDFQSPRDGYEIVLTSGDTVPAGETIRFSVEASETPWEERRNRWGTMILGTEVERIEVWLDDRPAPILTASETTWLNLDWDPAGLPAGDHRVKVRAYSHGCGVPLTSTHHLIVSRYQERLTLVSRTVTPQGPGNYFKVRLRLRNDYLSPVTPEGIHDDFTGFQLVPETKPDYRTVLDSFDWNSLSSRVYIRFDPDVTIPRFGTYDVEYLVVPVLHYGFDDYVMGSEPVMVVFDDPAGHSQVLETSLTRDGTGFRDDVFEAAAAADYLLVTNPRALYGLFPSAEVDQLLGKMAELASLRQGVLGFINTFTVVPSTFSFGDQLGAGELVPGDIHANGEIAMIEWSDRKLKIYGGDRHLYSVDYPELNSLCRLAVGNFSDLAISPEGFPLGVDEIAIANGSGDGEGEVAIYQFQHDPEGFVEIDSFDADFRRGDGLACGQFDMWLGDDNEREIVIARSDDGDCEIYDQFEGSGEWSRWDTAGTVFREGDGFAVGNVISHGDDEIIVADIDADLIYLYDLAGWSRSFAWDLSPGDRILTADAFGDAWSSGYEELVIFERSRGRISTLSLSFEGGVVTARLVGSQEYSLHEYDGYAAGKILSIGKEQILVGHGATQGGFARGDIDIISNVGDSAGNRNILDSLIDEGGEWASRLAPGWTSGGHLLIVGEIQIIPAFCRTFTLNDDDVTVRVTDNYYASTNDDIFYPNLSAGRIIGNDPGKLVKPIQASIDLARGTVHLRNRWGAVASGSNRGPGGDSDDINFTEERTAVGDLLEDRGFTVVEMHVPEVDYFFDQVNYHDLIHMTGHGNAGLWDVITWECVDDNFEVDVTRPLVYADSCLTGKYTSGYSFAESWLNNGASAYIGASESGRWPSCKWLTTRFYDQLAEGRPLGECLRAAKGNVIGAGEWYDRDYNRYNATIYHLFGDPKITLEWDPSKTKTSTDETAAVTVEHRAYATSLEVTLPDYKLTAGHIQRAEIPGGGALLVPGEYEVPLYTTEVKFPAGTRVQGVSLKERGGLSEAANVNLPLVEVKIPGDYAGQGKDPQAPARPGEAAPEEAAAANGSGLEWWPDQGFDWLVREEAGGGSVLVLTIYPFDCSGKTGDVRYFRNFKFDIATAPGGVDIRRLQTGKASYRTGETVRGDLFFEVTGEKLTEVLVEAAILQSEGDPVAGLPLRSLADVHGLVSCSLDWDSTGAAGDFLLSVTLRNTSGGILAAANCSFEVGRATGRISQFKVTPECFASGDKTELSATFTNTGGRPLDGTLVMEVQDAARQPLTRFEKDFTALSPGKSFENVESWIAATAGREDCSFVAYALLEGGTTIPVALPALVTGDLNQDFVLDAADLLLLLYQLQEKPPEGWAGPPDCVLDVDGNGKFDIQDAAALAKRLAEAE